ncbi:MAG: hypothetical protein FJX74_09140 [Armatimonadetes bacterium]|nr:hypothetical protein [Armatimonadota bacterium]
MLVLLAQLLTLAAAPSSGQAPERVTPIIGDLKGDTRGDVYAYSGGGCTVEQRNGGFPVETVDGEPAVRITIEGRGGYWGIGVARAGWVRWYLDDYGPTGVLRFDVRGAQGGERFRIGVKDSDRDGDGPDTDVQTHVPVSAYATLTSAWQTVDVPVGDLIAAQPRFEPADCICVLLANDGDAQSGTFHLRHLRFVTTSPERAYPPIKVNQVGYLPAMRKIARISAPVTELRVLEAETGAVVATVPARPVIADDPASGDSLWEADFSEIRSAGAYRLEAEGLEPSAPFTVSEAVYDGLYRDAMRFYLFQRCGTELLAPQADRWARPACHVADARALTREGADPRDCVGGWHDAGDCNKYPCWVRLPLFMLLDLYDLVEGSDLASDGYLGIPESGNGVPDLLDEAMWELDWLLKMQIADGPQAGAVYDRLHQSAAPGGEHERLQEERRLLPPTAESTGTCAAVWARAAATLQRVPGCEAKAETYLAAARLAFSRLQADAAPPEHVLPAAICLYEATGEPAFRETVAALLEGVIGDPGSFRSADRFIFAPYDCGVAALARSTRETGELRDKARRLLVAVADAAVSASRKDGYGVPLWSPGHYCWSSSQIISKMGYYAALANTYQPREEYAQLAEDCLHYLLGRNAVDTCFVTGYGTRRAEVYSSVYGGSSAAFQPTPPGCLGGGVNQWESRGISTRPAKNWRPDPNNWTLNEVAIYYNAPLAFLSGYVARGDD